MNRIEKLIEELCPDGVEYKPMGEVGKFYGGLKGKSKQDFSHGIGKYVIYKSIYKNISVNLENAEKVNIGENENQLLLQYGDVLFTGSSENIEEVGLTSVVVDNIELPLYLNSFSICFRFEDDSLLNPHFSKYLFRSDYLRKQIRKTANGVTRINISKKLLAKVLIPIPPLAVQDEIVKILDSFTLLEAELEAELEARQQQYYYYRDYLFKTIENENLGKWKNTEEICSSVTSGGTPITSRKEYYGGDIPWLRTQEVDWKEIYRTEIGITESGLKNSSAKIIPPDSVIIAMYGATAAKSAVNKIPLSTNQACCNLTIDKDKANYRYVYQWFVYKYLELKALGRGSQSNVNAKTIKNFPIYVPSLEEQARIVAVLDRFDALVNDISSGLPAEIAARRQQYEYYRDKLLTFPEKKPA